MGQPIAASAFHPVREVRLSVWNGTYNPARSTASRIWLRQLRERLGVDAFPDAAMPARELPYDLPAGTEKKATRDVGTS